MSNESQIQQPLDSNFCPRCGRLLKEWKEMSEQEKIVFLRIGKLTAEIAQRHRFCERCLFIATERLHQA
ncbi:MAG: hypothetical protein C4325_09985 [Blastocatellia bacterium]